MERNENKIVIDLDGDLQLVAEKSFDSGFPREISVYLTKKGRWIQDLALVGQHYKIDRRNYTADYSDQFSVKVWGVEYSEDFTEEFLIPLYREEDDSYSV